MEEQAIYNSEDGKWYRLGDDYLSVRAVEKGTPVRPFVEGVRAMSYSEAFEMLFGHPVVIPPVERSARRASAFEVRE